MADGMMSTIRDFAKQASDDSIRALDERSRVALERLTTDTAHAVAQFLYDRDSDIRQAALVRPESEAYRKFLMHRERTVYEHAEWRLKKDGSGWEAAHSEGVDLARMATASEALVDNSKHFNARPPEYRGTAKARPLFVEMTYIDLQGHERVKLVNGELTNTQLADISDKRQTFLGAEDYWSEVRKLAAGEIYVSEVIGAYVGSRVIGPYTPASAEKAGIEFAPEASAYAGTENPLGKRFRGIVRWATPAVEKGRIIGYVTLALDHEHLRQFTDRLSPTSQRYTEINDAITGNYAFMWDHKSRAISHPRDYFIVGFDPNTGERVVPWLSADLYRRWRDSGLPAEQFLASVEPFEEQSLDKKPALEMIRSETIALDCRYLNFSPQCAGWKQLTEKGGSGSFVIFFSGLWKLTTAAAIPYYTGQYGKSSQGFGFVTIGANVDEFHRAATQSATRIGNALDDKRAEFGAQRSDMLQSISANLEHTAKALGLSTALMIAAVIAIACWMAAFLTRRITRLSEGIERFRSGDLDYRLSVRSQDEMGQLSASLNRMADAVQESFARLDEARLRAVEANRTKSNFLASMSHELRTPLNGILGFADLLTRRAESQRTRQSAQTIYNSGQHLLEIVNDLLDMARIEAGKMKLEADEIAIEDFVREVCAGHQRHAHEKGLEFLISISDDCPETFVSDSVRVRQVLNNLLNNAVKFTDEGRVSVELEPRDDGIAFSVRDTGRGVPKDSKERIFEAFTQAESFITRSRDGTGLGLALVKELAGRLGAALEMESEPGVGSCFTVTFPPNLTLQD